MKKTILMIAMATLCLFFKAQSQNIPIDVISEGIQIGQKIPNVVLNEVHNYKSKTAKISDFEGKLLILDFWATWCSPCVAMRPKMEELQQKFDGKVQFLSLTYEKAGIVLPFLEKLSKGKQGKVPDVIGEETLHKLFPHIYLPHYVWVDQNGVVKAITGMEEVTAENINKMLNSSEVTLARKKDMSINYDIEKPLLVNRNGGDGRNLIYHSVLTGYTVGLSSEYAYNVDSNGNKKICMTNVSLPIMYQLAFGERNKSFIGNRTIIEVKDSSRLTSSEVGNSLDNWYLNGNGYCYEILVPKDKDLFGWMRADLDRYFNQYSVTVEKRMTNALVLLRTSTKDKIKSTGGVSKSKFSNFGFSLKNFPLNRLFTHLNYVYLQNYFVPIVDGTNYSSWVDIEINASPSDVDAMNKELDKYDLKFVEKRVEVDFMVIRDKVK